MIETSSFIMFLPRNSNLLSSKDLPRHTKDTLDNFPFFSHVQLFAIQNASYFSATPVVSTTEGAEKVESVCLNKDAKQAFEGGDGGNQKIEVDEATVNKVSVSFRVSFSNVCKKNARKCLSLFHLLILECIASLVSFSSPSFAS